MAALRTFVFSWLLSLSFCAASYAAELRTPVIFEHGLGVSGDIYENLGELKALFARHNRPFLIAMTPSAGTIEERSAVLKQEIARLVPHGKLHLVAHSMGGLDARLAVQDPALAERVLSISTMSTPHHGSPVAEYVIQHLGSLPSDSLLREVLQKLFAGNIRAAEQLTPSNMDQSFNVRVADDSRIRYYSMGFYIPAPVSLHSLIPWLWFTHGINSDAGFAQNDGLVSAESAHWGRYLGTFAGDHYSETYPIPLIGGPGYLELYAKILKNIEKDVEGSFDQAEWPDSESAELKAP